MSTFASVFGQPVSSVAAKSDATSSSNTAESAKITANEFLTLLVTELKNQDPTANTDPNDYINQLVAVNSLQQLISINETLASASSSSASSVADRQLQSNAVKAYSDTATSSGATRVFDGNLSAPSASHAADRLAHSLSSKL